MSHKRGHCPPPPPPGQGQGTSVDPKPHPLGGGAHGAEAATAVGDPLRSGRGLERDGLHVVRISQGANVLAPRARRPQARGGQWLPWCYPGLFEQRRECIGRHDDVAPHGVNLHIPHDGEEIHQNDAKWAAL